MRYALIFLCILLGSSAPAIAQLSINFGAPGISIGINMPVYPQLQRIPGYPVYYAPGVSSNYFFYDGLYWVFDNDGWYASSWYNGPWHGVDSMDVPVFLLRVPVRYYRHAPAYFRGWRADAAPHWGDHWGPSWEQRRRGWDQWNRSSAPAPAPLPAYQRQYSGNRYPQASQQVVIETQNYRYQPRDPVAQQHYRQRAQAQPSQPQRAERQQQQAPAAPKPPQPQHAERQQQQAPVAPRPPQPQHAERQPQQAPPAQQASRPQAEERSPQGKGQGHEKGPKEKDGKEKDGKEKDGKENEGKGKGG